MNLALAALLAAVCALSIGLATADAYILPSLAFAAPALRPATHLRQNPFFCQKRQDSFELQRTATFGQLRMTDDVKLSTPKLPRGLQERSVNIGGEVFKVALSPT